MSDSGNTSGENKEKLTPEMARLKVISSRNLSTVSLIMAPVSLFIGGVFLSIVALIFGIVAFVKANSVMHAGLEQDPYVRVMRVRALIGIGISLLALVLNTYALVTMLPILMEMINGDSIQDIMSALQDSSANSPDGLYGDRSAGGTGKDSVFG